MLIKPHYKFIDGVEDIHTIIEKRRYIFVYNYDRPHKMLSSTNLLYSCSDFFSDIYLVNESTVKGDGFLIPKGLDLHVRNTYRGYAQFASIKDCNGKTVPNYDSIIDFYFGTYVNHLKRKKEPLISIASINQQCSGPGFACYEDEFQALINSNGILQPFPQFYNVEDMAYLDSKHIKTSFGDFTYDFDDCPKYRFGDLIDRYTKVIFVDVPEHNGLIDHSAYDSAGEPSRNVIFNGTYNVDTGSFKSAATECCMRLNEYLIDSIFSEATFVIDTESALFNITKLRLKYLTVSEEDKRHESERLCVNVGDMVDSLFGENDFPNEAFSSGYYPTRLTIHIGADVCHMKFSNPETKVPGFDNKGNKILTQLSSVGESSTSDIDQITSIYANDGFNSW